MPLEIPCRQSSHVSSFPEPSKESHDDDLGQWHSCVPDVSEYIDEESTDSSSDSHYVVSSCLNLNHCLLYRCYSLQNLDRSRSAASCPTVKAADKRNVCLAENIYNSVRADLLHVQIHRDQIFREYEQHRDYAVILETKLNSIRENVLVKFHVDLKDYQKVVMPVYEGSARR